MGSKRVCDCTTGSWNGVGNGRCTKCSGTGVNVHLNSPKPECGDCGGNGVCPVCNGTGTRPREDDPLLAWIAESISRAYATLRPTGTAKWRTRQK
jgi:DnaJ-class molecular chaperone